MWGFGSENRKSLDIINKYLMKQETRIYLLESAEAKPRLEKLLEEYQKYSTYDPFVTYSVSGTDIASARTNSYFIKTMTEDQFRTDILLPAKATWAENHTCLEMQPGDLSGYSERVRKSRKGRK